MYFCIFTDRFNDSMVGSGDTIDEAFKACEESNGDPLNHNECKFYEGGKIAVERKFVIVEKD